MALTNTAIMSLLVFLIVADVIVSENITCYECLITGCFTKAQAELNGTVSDKKCLGCITFLDTGRRMCFEAACAKDKKDPRTLCCSTDKCNNEDIPEVYKCYDCTNCRNVKEETSVTGCKACRTDKKAGSRSCDKKNDCDSTKPEVATDKDCCSANDCNDADLGSGSNAANTCRINLGVMLFFLVLSHFMLIPME